MLSVVLVMVGLYAKDDGVAIFADIQNATHILNDKYKEVISALKRHV